jgi:hypothetical protein
MLTSEGTKVGPRLGIAHSNLLLWAHVDIDCEWCETAIQRSVIPNGWFAGGGVGVLVGNAFIGIE